METKIAIDQDEMRALQDAVYTWATTRQIPIVRMSATLAALSHGLIKHLGGKVLEVREEAVDEDGQGVLPGQLSLFGCDYTVH
jgi:hypothetical protein